MPSVSRSRHYCLLYSQQKARDRTLPFRQRADQLTAATAAAAAAWQSRSINSIAWWRDNRPKSRPLCQVANQKRQRCDIDITRRDLKRSSENFFFFFVR
ncbi:Ubiquitin-related modifier [Trichinella pseudospiralis]